MNTLAGLLLSATTTLAPFAKTLEKPFAGARDKKMSCVVREKGVFETEYDGKVDWAVNGIGRVKVKPGEFYELSCASGKTSDGRALGSYAPSVILRRADGAVIDWVRGKRVVPVGESVKSVICIPLGAAIIEPRLIGVGAVAGSFGPFTVTRTRQMEIRDFPPETLANEFLRVVISPNDGRLAVANLKTGRTWQSAETIAEEKAAGLGEVFCVNVHRNGANALECVYEDPYGVSKGLTVRHRLEDSELVVELIPADLREELTRLSYPHPFDTHSGDRFVVPKGEGMSFPVDEKKERMSWMLLYCGGSCSMNFGGFANTKTGEAAMMLVETPWDAEFKAFVQTSSKCLTATTQWGPQMGVWGEPRRVRLIFFDKGGHVAMAKRFRRYAKGMGWVRTFKEKAIQRPDVLKLPGALNFWFWGDGDPDAMVDELARCGIDRYIWSHGGKPDFVRKMREKGVLIGTYDVCQDVYTPEVMQKAGWKGKGKNSEAWPQDIAWTSPNSNDWRRAWSIELKGSGYAYCASMCDAKAPGHLRRRLAPELATKPYSMRFMDTTFAAPLKECWNPAHALNRPECLVWRHELLRMMCDEFGLVVGTECGMAPSVPVCDYFEGMMSPGEYRLPRAGRDVGIHWTNAVPAYVEKYQVGERYRVPLWELVFHECSCAHWYWGDCNDKVLSQWTKRDLFNVLYATAPMFVCTRQYWDAHRDRYVKSYRDTVPLATECGLAEMIDHEYLTDDCSVQRTRFSNGVVITVNFGARSYRLPNGTEIAPFSYRR